MAAKKRKGKGPSSRKTATLQEQVGEIIREVEADLGVVREQWNRYNEDGIKKGFKEARKAVLRVKKGCMEIRKAMSNIDL